MVVLRACVYLQTGCSLAADRILREHTLHCQLNCQLRTLSHEGLVLGFLQAANPARMSLVVLLSQLVAGQDCLGSVDNDNEIAGINVRGELYLMLAAKESCYSSCGTTQRLVCCVDDIPLAVNVLSLSHISGHDLTSDLYV